MLIHVAKTTVKEGWSALTETQLKKIFLHKNELYGDNEELPHGAIIGSVVIEDCVQSHPSVWAEKGCWKWVLKNALLFDEPIDGGGEIWNFVL